MKSKKPQSIKSYAKMRARSLSFKIFIVGVISVFLLGALVGTYYYRGQLMQTTNVVTRSLSQPMGLGGEFLPSQIIKTLVESGNFKDVWVTTSRNNVHVEAHSYDIYPELKNIKDSRFYWNNGLPHIVVKKPVIYGKQVVGKLFVGYQIPIYTIFWFTVLISLLFTLISLYLYSRIQRLANSLTAPFTDYSVFLKENVGSEHFFKHNNNWMKLDEINSFNEILINYILKSKENENIARKAISKAQIAKVASRVKHDVIASLDIGESALDSISDNTKQIDILKTVFERISDTVEDIPKIGSLTELEINIAAGNETSELDGLEKTDKSRKCHIASLIYQIVGEIKLSKISQSKRVKFKTITDKDSFDAFAEIAPVKFKRNLLNLYKNAIEAVMEDGYIETTISLNNEFLEISIKDNGCGIPEDILPKIGKRGATFNKINGTGIGLAAAIEDIENWNGELTISSKENVGSKVLIKLPISDVDYLYPTTLYFAPGMEIVIVDDDPIVHKVWERKLVQEKLVESSIKTTHFNNLDDATLYINKLENSDTDYILLIDNDLRHKEYTGLQFITQRSIESKSILVTSSGNSNWLHNECCKSKLPIVPKSILERIPVQILN